MGSTNVTLHAKSTILLLSSAGGEGNLKPIARNKRTQIVVILSWRWGSWPRLHYAGIKLLLEWKHMNWCVIGWHCRSLRYRARIRLQCNVPLLSRKGNRCCGLCRVVNSSRCCGCGRGGSSSRSTGSTRWNSHRCSSRWRRCRSETILQRNCCSERKPVHRFGLYSSHYRFSLKFFDFFS